MFLFWSYFVHFFLSLFCSYFVLILFLFCSYFVLILFLFCSYFVLILFLFCSYFVLILFLFCSCFVLVLFLFYHLSFLPILILLVSWCDSIHTFDYVFECMTFFQENTIFSNKAFNTFVLKSIIRVKCLSSHKNFLHIRSSI